MQQQKIWCFYLHEGQKLYWAKYDPEKNCKITQYQWVDRCFDSYSLFVCWDICFLQVFSVRNIKLIICCLLHSEFIYQDASTKLVRNQIDVCLIHTQAFWWSITSVHFFISHLKVMRLRKPSENKSPKTWLSFIKHFHVSLPSQFLLKIFFQG